MEVYSIATQRPLYKGPEETVLDALEVMVKHKFRRIPIVYVEGVREIEELIGIITANDILGLLDTKGIEVLDIPLEEVMVPDPIAVMREEDLGRATEIMVQEGFGSLPIVSDESNTIAGIITERDMVRAFVKSLADADLKEFMAEPVTLNFKRATLRSVLRKLHTTKASRIILTSKKNKIEGIVTNSDILSLIYKHISNGEDLTDEIMSTPVKEFAVTDVITAHMDDSVAEVAKKLLENNLGGVPVVDDDGLLVGVFSERELLNMIGTFQLFSTIED